MPRLVPPLAVAAAATSAARGPRALLIAWYCLAIGSVGALHPFLSLTLARRGADPAEIALILTLFPLGLLFGGPLWGLLADRAARPERVVAAAATVAALGAAVTLVPGGFLVMLPGLILIAASRSPAISLGDVLAIRLLGGGREGERRYGGTRMWGSVAFIGSVLLVGELGGGSPYVPLLVTALLLTGMAALSLWLRPPTARPPEGDGGEAGEAGGIDEAPLAPLPTASRSSTPTALHAARQLLSVRPLRRLYLIAILHVSGLSIYDNLFSHHAAAAGLSDRLMSLAFALGVAAEVAVLGAAPFLLRRLSPRVLLALAVLASAPRWWITGTTSSPALLVGTQALHGVTFGMWWIGGLARVLRVAPPELRSTAQASFVAAGFGLGNLGALLVASLVLPRVGSGPMFLGLAGVSLCAALLLPWALRDEDGG